MGGMIPLGDASRRLRRWPVVTILLILANVYVFTRELIYGDAFVYYYSAIPVYIVAGNRWWTIFTAMFMHAGWLHIMGNMIFFWAFGPEIEDAMGRCGTSSSFIFAEDWPRWLRRWRPTPFRAFRIWERAEPSRR